MTIEEMASAISRESSFSGANGYEIALKYLRKAHSLGERESTDFGPLLCANCKTDPFIKWMEEVRIYAVDELEMSIPDARGLKIIDFRPYYVHGLTPKKTWEARREEMIKVFQSLNL